MADKIIVEVIDPKNEVRERLRFDAFPINVGRSYANHVIVDDEYVSAMHCSIERRNDGGFTVRDNGTVNQILNPRTHKRAASIDLEPGDSFLLGKTRIRVCTAGMPVPDARPFTSSGPKKRMPLWVAMLLSTLSLSLLAVYTFAFNKWIFLSYEFREGKELEQSFRQCVSFLISIFIYASLWSVVGRLYKHRTYFLSHVYAVSFAILTACLLDDFCSWGAFAFNEPDGAYALYTALLILLYVILFKFSLRLATNIKSRKRLLAALSMAALLGFVPLGFRYFASQSFKSYPSITANLSSDRYRVAPLLPPTVIENELADLRKKVDSEIKNSAGKHS